MSYLLHCGIYTHLTFLFVLYQARGLKGLPKGNLWKRLYDTQIPHCTAPRTIPNQINHEYNPMTRPPPVIKHTQFQSAPFTPLDDSAQSHYVEGHSNNQEDVNTPGSLETHSPFSDGDRNIQHDGYCLITKI